MPFGLCTAPATFQRLMQYVLQPVLGKSSLVYLDDIIIYSTTFEENLEHLAESLKLIEGSGLKLSPEKCSFVKRKLHYLGHFVSAEGIMVDPNKIKAMKNMVAPKTPREVRRFIGMCSYYRKFVQNFSEKASSLTVLTKKNQRFHWGKHEEEAFNNLKNSLVEAPILHYPDYELPFQLLTDASDVALGAVLTQRKEGVDLPIAFYSRKFSGAECCYSTT